MKDIQLCDDGVYRWTYAFHMLKNPIIILTVWKIFLYIILGLWVVFGLIGIVDTGSVTTAFVRQAQELVLPAIILFVLSAVGYLVLAGIYGLKYYVLFEMDEEGIRHIHMAKQFKKAQALSWLTVMAGVAAGKPGTVGTGLLSATKNEMYSEFSKVRKMKVIRPFHTIKLGAPLSHNQIYANGEDFDFVLNYISQRVNKA